MNGQKSTQPETASQLGFRQVSSTTPLRYRLGLDLGSTSIGWAVLELDQTDHPIRLVDAGVRIFNNGRDPKSEESLAKDRRTARSMRRRRDRFVRRRDDLMTGLVSVGLMPTDKGERKNLELLDPYDLRARGLDEELPLFHLGRALFHLHQRRGFKSNRRTDKSGDDSGKIKSAITQLKKAIDEAECRTMGEYLAQLHLRREGVRARLIGEGAKAAYELYPERDLIEAEFDALWAAQATYHPQLNEAAKDRLKGIFFRQRPLKPVKPGRCALIPEDERAPWALPAQQLRRLYEQLNQLKILCPGEPDRPLRLEERDLLASKLKYAKATTFGQAHKALKLSPHESFNLESEVRDKLIGNETAALLGKKDLFGNRWKTLSLEQQSEIVERLLTEEDEDALLAWLQDSWNLSPEEAAKVASAPIPEGYARIGRQALAALLPHLMEGKTEHVDPESGEFYLRPLLYNEAVALAGYHHSDRRPGELRARLPYYGEALAHHVSGSGDPQDSPEDNYGRITNPTVHIGLNQLRKVVNRIIDYYGAPTQMVIELTRDLKLGQQKKKDLRKTQAENKKKNDLRVDKLKDLDLPDNGGNRLLLRLWEELNPNDVRDRRCVYTGEVISIERLFSHEVEVEHILPFSDTLDNSIANKTLSLRQANRDKGKRSPHDAFGTSPTLSGRHYSYADILARAQSLPKNKRWRFEPDAMETFQQDSDEGNGWLARQLVDTAYFSRLARSYLCEVCDSNQVWVLPGRMTDMLRGRWGLNHLLGDHNQKNRNDHRHHAIDALVAGLTDRALLQKISAAAARSEERLLDDMPRPWPNFTHEDFRDALSQIKVSHRAEHGLGGQLHEDTAYGSLDPDLNEGFNLVYRKAFMGLNESELRRIRDRDLRQEVLTFLGLPLIAEKKSKKLTAKDLKDQLSAYNQDRAARGLTPVKRVRLLKREDGLIEVRHGSSQQYLKYYSPGDNHQVQIFDDGSGRWRGEGITRFQANQQHHKPAWKDSYPAARLKMKVHKGDLILLEKDGQETLYRVQKLAVVASVLFLAAHNETGDLQKRHDDPDDPFRWLMASFNKLPQMKARRVQVNELGRINDPGWQDGSGAANGSPA
ncbi:type II CRISPR RNA-guided endonuclease Cas9 [Rhodovibrionaceae bacterium A322]